MRDVPRDVAWGGEHVASKSAPRAGGSGDVGSLCPLLGIGESSLRMERSARFPAVPHAPAAGSQGRARETPPVPFPPRRNTLSIRCSRPYRPLTNQFLTL